MEKINPFGNVPWSFEDISIIRLVETQLPSLDCGQEEQNSYLRDHATVDQQIGASVTYVLVFQKKLAGFATLTMDEIPLFPFERPEQVQYSRMPAVKIAQLGVDVKFQNQRLGQVLITFAIAKAQELSKEIGCRFVTLDAKKNRQNWYERQGFKLNKLDQKERKEKQLDAKNLPVSMRLDIQAVVPTIVPSNK